MEPGGDHRDGPPPPRREHPLMAPQWSPVAITGMGATLPPDTARRQSAAMEPGGDHRDGEVSRHPAFAADDRRNGARWRSPGWATGPPAGPLKSSPPQWSPVAITGMGFSPSRCPRSTAGPQWSPVAITGMGVVPVHSPEADAGRNGARWRSPGWGPRAPPAQGSCGGRNGARWRSPGWDLDLVVGHQCPLVPQWSPVAITGMGIERLQRPALIMAPQWSPVAITGMGSTVTDSTELEDRAAMEPGGDHRDGELPRLQASEQGAAAMEPGGDHRDGAAARRREHGLLQPQWSPVAITGMGNANASSFTPWKAPQWSPVAITGMGPGRRRRWFRR